MTPEILLESERREFLCCVVCGKPPPETVVQRFGSVASLWLCPSCLDYGVASEFRDGRIYQRFTWNSTPRPSRATERYPIGAPDAS